MISAARVSHTFAGTRPHGQNTVASVCHCPSARWSRGSSPRATTGQCSTSRQIATPTGARWPRSESAGIRSRLCCLTPTATWCTRAVAIPCVPGTSRASCSDGSGPITLRSEPHSDSCAFETLEEMPWINNGDKRNYSYVRRTPPLVTKEILWVSGPSTLRHLIGGGARGVDVALGGWSGRVAWLMTTCSYRCSMIRQTLPNGGVRRTWR